MRTRLVAAFARLILRLAPLGACGLAHLEVQTRHSDKSAEQRMWWAPAHIQSPAAPRAAGTRQNTWTTHELCVPACWAAGRPWWCPVTSSTAVSTLSTRSSRSPFVFPSWLSPGGRRRWRQGLPNPVCCRILSEHDYARFSWGIGEHEAAATTCGAGALGLDHRHELVHDLQHKTRRRVRGCSKTRSMTQQRSSSVLHVVQDISSC